MAPRRAAIVATFASAVVGGAWLRYERSQARTLRRLEDRTYRRLGDLDAVDALRILPLVERNAARPELRGEPGVSYLITAGGETILFDTGLNAGSRTRKRLHRMPERSAWTSKALARLFSRISMLITLAG